MQTVGNLGRDPEIKYFDTGSIKCSLAVAVKQRGIKQKDGSFLDPQAWWLEVELWGKNAERLANKLHKGDTVDVRGEVKRETFVRKSGEPGEKIVIQFATVDLIKAKNPEQQQQPPAPVVTAQQGAQSLAAALQGDEIPF